MVFFKSVRIFILLVVLIGITSSLMATPIINIANDKIEDLISGSPYAYYQNSGGLLFIKQGNNQGNFFSSVQEEMQIIYGSEFILTETGTSTTSYDNKSGTWTSITDPLSEISFYAVKAGNYYAMYIVDPAETTGSWSTFDIWITGLLGTGGLNGLEISHFTGYNASVSVPEPSTLLLLGSGLIGLGVLGRKRFRKS